jgi:superfamily II DNA or RNA helicase
MTTSPADVRAAIARAWLTDRNRHTSAAAPAPAPAQLGTVALHTHQRTAADRLIHMLAADRGALLADPTGQGKTYIALAVAAALAHHPTIIAPANLRPMWREALSRTQITAAIRSIESLSQQATPKNQQHKQQQADADLLIVDEAHHFRNPSTRRYHALVALATHTPILLISATPIHNDTHDLRAILALFLGSQAHTTDHATLARYIVRRDQHGPSTRDQRTPTVDPPVWLAIPHDESTLQAIEKLPAPVPPSDGAAAGALVTHALVRQWASSHGALRNALRRRLERAAALESALTHNRHPTYRDLRSWCLGDGAIQLAFPELLIPPSTESNPRALLEAVRTHTEAVRALLKRLDKNPLTDADHHRANRIRDILAKHAGQPVVAFSAYEDTVHALAHHLARDTRVCALASHTARVANGTISRRQAIARFAPAANHARPPAPAHRIDLLITTDLLSEGVNLQDAAAVIHLDLPWTPARIEQRIGRVARLGSPHPHTAVYAIAPPASSESLLGVDHRLRLKLHEAGRTFGLAGSILPPPLTTPPTTPPTYSATIRATLERWLTERSEAQGVVGTTATVMSPRPGFIAACRISTTPYLVASLDGNPPSDAPSTVAEALTLSETQPQPVERDRGTEPSAYDDAAAALNAWIQSRQAHHDAGVAGAPSHNHLKQHTRTTLLRRVAATIRRAPPDRRPATATLAARARKAAVTPLTAGAERLLADLALSTDVDDTKWLATVADFAEQHAREPTQDGDTEIVAVLLLRPITSAVNLPAGCPPPPSLPSYSTSTAPCSTRSSSCSAPSATPSATGPDASPRPRSGSRASAPPWPARCASTPQMRGTSPS